jgi:hypothetical protein
MPDLMRLLGVERIPRKPTVVPAVGGSSPLAHPCELPKIIGVKLATRVGGRSLLDSLAARAFRDGE